jgi:hypothetical protein
VISSTLSLRGSILAYDIRRDEVGFVHQTLTVDIQEAQLLTGLPVSGAVAYGYDLRRQFDLGPELMVPQ